MVISLSTSRKLGFSEGEVQVLVEGHLRRAFPVRVQSRIAALSGLEGACTKARLGEIGEKIETTRSQSG